MLKGMKDWECRSEHVVLSSSHQGDFKIDFCLAQDSKYGCPCKQGRRRVAVHDLASEIKLHHFHHSLLVEELQTHLNARGRDIEPTSQ